MNCKQDTYSETTSGGKLCGTDLTFSHKALSLVHVHPEGHLGCLPLLLSTNSSSVATQSRKVYRLMLLFACPILSAAGCCGVFAGDKCWSAARLSSVVSV